VSFSSDAPPAASWVAGPVLVRLAATGSGVGTGSVGFVAADVAFGVGVGVAMSSSPFPRNYA
jgi:hypothetical protein